MRRTASACLLAFLVLAAPARGDGLPVAGVDAGATGVAVGGLRYVTIGRTVAAVRVRGGKVVGWRALPGSFTVPAVAYDGSPSGLSANGRTLVLIRPRPSFPRRRTELAVLDVPQLVVRRVLRLRGDYSFDAIAPDGRTIYLIQYTSPRDPTRYRVRAYDLATRRFDPRPIVDPREPDEAMRGAPITRATSPDGRWAYTLYDGAGHEPFVHALDTVGRTAKCLDLPALEGRRDLQGLKLVLGQQLTVTTPAGRVVARIGPRPRRAAAAGTQHGVPWGLLAGGLALAGVAALAAARPRARSAPRR